MGVRDSFLAYVGPLKKMWDSPYRYEFISLVLTVAIFMAAQEMTHKEQAGRIDALERRVMELELRDATRAAK